MNKVQTLLIEQMIASISKKLEYFVDKISRTSVRIDQLRAERAQLLALLEKKDGAQ